MMPRIDAGICDGCGECLLTCPHDAIIMRDGKATIDSNLCMRCEVCIDACPLGAISAAPHKEKAPTRRYRAQRQPYRKRPWFHWVYLPMTRRWSKRPE
jgi:ferredoxin